MAINSHHETLLTIGEFVENAPPDLCLEALAGRDGFEGRALTSARIQKLGLALANSEHFIHPGRLQILGQSEIGHLEHLTPDDRLEVISSLAFEKISCALVTKNLQPPEEFISAAEHSGSPVLRTPLRTSLAITIVTDYLRERLAPRVVRHGVLLDVYGLGILIEGSSGIGKSECALDLIARGHRLVADDVVEMRRTGADQLIGSAPELLREHLEIRGLGIINIRDIFGVSAISSNKSIDLYIRLERWEQAGEVDRLGIDAKAENILGVGVPQVVIPVSPGRNLATLVETAARVQLLRRRGHDAAQAFVARHTKLLEPKDETIVDDNQKSGRGEEEKDKGA